MFLVGQFPILRQTTVEIGVEQLFFSDLLVKEGNLAAGDFTNDFRSTVGVIQFSNVRQYLGYRLTTQLGYSLRRTSREVVGQDTQGQTDSSVFMTIYAGLRE